jgi:hypothetical protein
MHATTSASSSEIFEKEHIDKKEYLKNELKSLGIEPKRKDQLNDNEELQNLSDNIKQAMFQDYKHIVKKEICIKKKRNRLLLLDDRIYRCI